MTSPVLIDKDLALEMRSIVEYFRINGLLSSGGRKTADIINGREIYVRNDDADDAPPFACMQVTGTAEVGGQNYLTVEQPSDASGAAGWYLFNGPTEIEADGGFGIAFDGPLCRMLTDGSTITAGGLWGPVVGQWEIEPGGSLFVAAGEDDIATDVMRGFFRASTGMYLYTLTSSTNGTIKNMADTVTIATGVPVVDTLSMFSDQVSGDRGICCLDGGTYYRVQAPCKT